jgi:hypothetical protein
MRDLSSGVGKFLTLIAVTALGAMIFAPLAAASPVLGWAQSSVVLSHNTAADSGTPASLLNGIPERGADWQIGSSATLRTDVTFATNTIDVASVALDPIARISYGRAYGPTGAARLTDNRVPSNAEPGDPGSGLSVFGSNGLGRDYVTPVPEPATLLLVGAGLIGVAASRKKFKKT